MDRADRVAAEQLRRVGAELRTARRMAGLGLRHVAEVAGCSHVEVSRIERGRAPWVTHVRVARLAGAVGLDVSLRVYPGPSPIRDGRSAALTATFRSLLGPGLRMRTEVPLPQPGDLRAWDGVVSDATSRVGVEAETEIHDVQALDRRIALKQRDGDMPVVLLVIADTKRNRAAVAAGSAVLDGRFPGRSSDAARALRRGELPAVSSIVWLRPAGPRPASPSDARNAPRSNGRGRGG